MYVGYDHLILSFPAGSKYIHWECDGELIGDDASINFHMEEDKTRDGRQGYSFKLSLFNRKEDSSKKINGSPERGIIQPKCIQEDWTIPLRRVAEHVLDREVGPQYDTGNLNLPTYVRRELMNHLLDRYELGVTIDRVKDNPIRLEFRHDRGVPRWRFKFSLYTLDGSSKYIQLR